MFVLKIGPLGGRLLIGRVFETIDILMHLFSGRVRSRATPSCHATGAAAIAAVNLILVTGLLTGDGQG
jgi:hypothetical protein